MIGNYIYIEVYNRICITVLFKYLIAVRDYLRVIIDIMITPQDLIAVIGVSNWFVIIGGGIDKVVITVMIIIGGKRHLFNTFILFVVLSESFFHQVVPLVSNL